VTGIRALLESYRSSALTERERGTYFEELILCYLRNETSYRDLYDEVWTYAQWAAQHGLHRARSTPSSARGPGWSLGGKMDPWPKTGTDSRRGCVAASV